MPALGMAQETGVLVEWFKAEGEEVVQGEPLMEVETDKATVEIEAAASGLLGGVTAQPGDEVPVGQVIALILEPGEEAPSKPEDLGDRVAAAVESGNGAEPDGESARPQDAGVAATPAALAVIGGRVPASPKARRLARERGLDIGEIGGSGLEGAVLAADVLGAARREPERVEVAPVAEGEVLDVSRAWKVMVGRLTQSWNEAPHFYLTAEAHVDELIRWRDEARQRGVEGITYTDLFVKVVAAALRQHPRLNGRWANDGIVLNEEINVGLAIAVEEGLVVPVIHRADRLNLKETAARRKELIELARGGKLTPDDLLGGTFTISNLGMYGVDAFNAIVNPPQAAILALGRIADRVVPVDGQPAVRPMVTLTLSCDHRAVDGARAAEFLQALVELIESPLQMLLVG